MRLDRAMATRFATLLALCLLFSPAPGRAEGGLLEFLFGPDPAPQPQIAPQRGRRDSAPARRVKGAVGDLRFARPKDGLPSGGGTGFSSEPTAGGFCVRTCDGYFFPLIKSTRATRQQSCEFACPSAPMEIYDGSTIESARNHKGQRYSSLPVAFAFRDRANSACSCNDPASSQAFFEKTARNDPTLQSGDVIVENDGAFVYSGAKLVPLSNASFMSTSLRDRLRAMLRRTTSVKTSEQPPASSTGEVDASKADQTGSTR
ncbi:DUF2865 domain-containing protein [Methylocystis parvus]|uniref:DUF2865 domain-containing protein n=2 Tax=Methylocystis parvus TaxID=134 RepID=A0A6B8MDU0_9HYPH|nr:DUF2865 domain-containing protein [Methylocystis parvus]